MCGSTFVPKGLVDSGQTGVPIFTQKPCVQQYLLDVKNKMKMTWEFTLDQSCGGGVMESADPVLYKATMMM